MTKDEFYDTIDFGVKASETFEQYITRVGGHIQEYKIRFGSFSPELRRIIIEIFESTIVPNQNNTKFQQVYNLLKHNLKREPTTFDLQTLVNSIKYEIDKPIQKYLNNIEVIPYKSLENE